MCLENGSEMSEFIRRGCSYWKQNAGELQE